MADAVPTTQSGLLTFTDQLIAGDVQSEADAEFVLTDPDRVALQALRDAAAVKLNERQILESQIQTKTEEVQTAFDALENSDRKATRVLKAVHGDNSPKLDKYGITSAETPGQPPEGAITIEACNETATSVEIRIQGGNGATRFSLHRRMQGEAVEQAVIIADNIKPGDRKFVDATIESTKRYLYFVMAHNAYGDAGPSNEVLATP